MDTGPNDSPRPLRRRGFNDQDLIAADAEDAEEAERLDQQKLQVGGSRDALVRVLFQLRGSASDLFRFRIAEVRDESH